MLKLRWSHFITSSNCANFIIINSSRCLRSTTSSQQSLAGPLQYFKITYPRHNFIPTKRPPSRPYVPANQYFQPKSSKHSSLKMPHNKTELKDEYQEAIRDLNSLQSNSQVLALAKYKKPETILPLFAKQLQLAGINVEDLDKLNAIHVSGTKGKGSTCAFLESILMSTAAAKGCTIKVGSYNSPHLIHVTERIKINGKPIDRQLFSRYFRGVFNKIKEASERDSVTMPSYFAFLTILAFHIFLKEQVNCAIVEVGIGGEYDPTNIIQRPVACAITTLDLDHTNILGNTIKDIAWTKAGIIKPGVPMYTVEHEQKEALEMIRLRAFEKNSPVHICKPLQLMSNRELGIRGLAQTINASVACQLAFRILNCLDCFRSSEEINRASSNRHAPDQTTNFESLPDSFQIGLEQSRLPGRCQIVETTDAIYFLDGAHTKKSMENCLDWFLGASRELNYDADKILMVNVIGERNKSQVLKPLLSKCHHFKQIIFTSNRILPADISSDSAHSESFVKAQDTNSEKSLENVKNNAKVWLDLVQEFDTNNSPSSHKPQLMIQSSISESLQSIMAHNNNITTNHEDQLLEKPHILSTGSLHFVGAILETIDSLYLNKTDKH